VKRPRSQDAQNAVNQQLVSSPTTLCDCARATFSAQKHEWACALALREVSSVNEFQMHLRWLAEQRRLADLERRWREAERIALRELLLASSDDDAENETGLEVNGDGESEASATDQ
jgi:hypothetical protein